MYIYVYIYIYILFVCLGGAGGGANSDFWQLVTHPPKVISGTAYHGELGLVTPPPKRHVWYLMTPPPKVTFGS